MDSLFGLDKVAHHDKDLCLLTTVYDRSALMILESILKDAEIPFLVKDRGVGTTVKVIAGFSVFGADVFILPEHLELATALLSPVEDETEEIAE